MYSTTAFQKNKTSLQGLILGIFCCNRTKKEKTV